MTDHPVTSLAEREIEVLRHAASGLTNREIAHELVELVREKIGPVASFKTATVVKRLPKTRSGKILRGTMKRMADGTEYTVPATIDDPVILDEIAESLKGLGYPRA